MKPMTDSEAAEELGRMVAYQEATFPMHPACQSSARRQIYALRLGMWALQNRGKSDERGRTEAAGVGFGDDVSVAAVEPGSSAGGLGDF